MDMSRKFHQINVEHPRSNLEELRARGDAILREMRATSVATEQNDLQMPTSSSPLAQILSCYALPSPLAGPLDGSEALGRMQKLSMPTMQHIQKLNSRRKSSKDSSEKESGVLEHSSLLPDAQIVLRFSSPQHALDELNKYFNQRNGGFP
eukprot:TRINITY_DN17389_c0_g1_i1.p1 TRINITY_DN17389_c0_g1~~TRINITY_DN17389_c0_g1_i1.p1  ORF type:complete len:150 (-),score=21.60 TRINITY_DN17389_c0_g1_i1:165-614(-)